MRKFSAGKGNQGEPIAEINITPLGDISLTLLIVMMILSPMIMQSMIRVFASQAAAAQQTQMTVRSAPVMLHIKKDHVILNTVKVNSETDLAKRLRYLLAGRHRPAVIVSADAGVLHGSVVSVLDIARQSGAEKISLMQNK